MSARHRKAIAKEIRTLRRSLSEVDRSLRPFAAMLSALDGGGGVARNIIARRRPRLSRKQRASLKLQGRYMGYMRQLTARQKAQVRKIREAKGVRAAIARARKVARA